MRTVAETPTFTRQTDKLLAEEERRALIDLLAEDPSAGEKIPGTAGVRKLRFAASGRDKRGGARVIYFYGGTGHAHLRATRLCEVRQNGPEPGRAARGGRDRRGDQACRKGEMMSTFGDDLIQSLNKALAHGKGEGPAVVHDPVTPREVRKRAKLRQAQMATLMGMSLSGYRKWEQGTRRVSGPAVAPLRVIQMEPEAVRRALIVGG